MADVLRKQLDELLGADRNEIPSKKGNEFTDPSNCRLFLAGMCTHDMFSNTKAKTGTCKKIHSIPMKNAYDIMAKQYDYGYEDILEKHLRSMIRDCDRRIELANKRIEDNEREILESSPYEKQIQELEEKQEKLGEEGNIDEYMKLQEEIDKLKEKRNIERYTPDFPEDEVGLVLAQHGTQPQHQVLRVCEVCGSLLSAKETKRLEDHYVGKLHMGFKLIREKLRELEKRDKTRPHAKEYETSEDRGETRHRSYKGRYRDDYDDNRYRNRGRHHRRRDYDNDRRYGGPYSSRYDRNYDSGYSKRRSYSRSRSNSRSRSP